MLSEQPAELPDPPSRYVSSYDSLRLRCRVLAYNVRLLQGPTAYETAGITIGLVGAVSGLSLLVTGFWGLGWVVRLVAGALVLVTVALWLRWLSRLPATFRLASRSPHRTERLREDMRTGMKNAAAFTVLERIYVPVVQAANAHVDRCGGSRHLQYVRGCEGGGNFLAVAVPAVADETLSELLEPQVGRRSSQWQRWAAGFAQERQDYVKAVRALEPEPSSGRGDEKGDNLVLDRLSDDGSLDRLRLGTSVGTYGQIVRTSDSLINEFSIFAHLAAGRRPRSVPQEPAKAGLVPAARRSADEAPAAASLRGRLRQVLRWGSPIDLDGPAALRVLPWRHALHPDARSRRRGRRRSGSPDVRIEDLLVRPTGRAAGIGVAVTMVDAGAEAPTAFVALRGSQVGTYPEARHVLPAGMCNLKSSLAWGRSELPADFLKWTMLGELVEECFRVKELERSGTEDWIADVERYCRQKRVSTDAPRFTGIAIDLLNLRPEVCAVVEVERRGGGRRTPRFTVNWEYDQDAGVDTVLLSEVHALCDRTLYVQSGVASLALAAHHYASRTPQEASEHV